MIGAIGLKLSETCKARLYLVGTYSLIDWNVAGPSALGDEFESYEFKESTGQRPLISVVQGLDYTYVLRLVETKRYILKIESNFPDEVVLPHFQNEGNKYLKCDRDKDSVSFQFVNYLGRSRIIFTA